jgi:response regulator RpfG family c-di-GMP phosphodiesterase
MENIFLCQGKLSPEHIEAVLTALNERYRKKMVQFSDHHADDYEPYEGHPDGKDLYDSYVEMTMKPTLDEQMNSPEFQLAAVDLHVTCLQQALKVLETNLFNALETVEFQAHTRMDRMQEEIQLIAEAVTSLECCEPDDYDTQEQVEEYSECSMCSDGCFCDEQEDAPCMIPMFLEDEPQEELPTEFWSREL